MIHPSYVELMGVVNDNVVIGEEPVVNSRYSIVCATAKRARQLIDGAEPLHTNASVYGKKPLSIAVEELYERELLILTPEEADEEYNKLVKLKEKNRMVRERRKELEAAQRNPEDEPVEAVAEAEDYGSPVDVDEDFAEETGEL